MRIQYEQSMPFGSARITLALGPDGMSYEAGPPLNLAMRIPWSSVTWAGTTVLDLSQKAGAAYPQAIASLMRRREMLIMSYGENGGRPRQVSVPLPEGIPRDGVVAEVRSFVGSRWAGEGVSVTQVPRSRARGGARQTAFVWLFILGVAVFVVLAFVLGTLLLALLANPFMLCLYAFLGGAWLFRRGFLEYRNRLAVSGTPTAKANSAAIGLAELAGRARGSNPTAALISGKPSVYWDIEVKQWIRRRDGKGDWHRLVHRESAPLDTIELEDETGRVPVWCHGAELILQTQRWRSNHEAEIPEPAKTLLGSIGKTWPAPSDPNHMHLTEKRLEEGGPLYVMGTLAECWRVQAAIGPKRARAAAHLQSQFRPGSASLSAVPVLAWAWLKRWMWQKVHGRAWSPPDLDPQRVLVWKGDQNRPFIVADRSERATITSLQRRMWLWILLGGGLMAGALYYFLDAIFSK